MHRKVCFFILMMLAGRLTLRAQTESVFLHLDKTIAYPGDTCWFRGYIFRDNHLSTVSTNLYVELYDSSNNLITRRVFPAMNTVSIGQVGLPMRPGLYWLRAYTRNSAFFLQSISIRSSDNPIVIRTLRDDKEMPVIMDTAGLFISTNNTAKAVVCTLESDSDRRYTDRPLRLALSSYGDSAGEYMFVLNKHRQKSIVIQKKNIRGYLTLRFYQGDTLLARQDIFVPQERHVPLRLVKDSGKYTFHIDDSAGWNYSLAIVRANQPVTMGTIMHSLSPSLDPQPTDTAYISIRGRVNRATRHSSLVSNKDIVMIIQKDSLSQTLLAPIDSSGSFSLSGFYFFDTARLRYMLNTPEGEKPKEIGLRIDHGQYPLFTPPDSSEYALDTLNLPVTWTMPVFDSSKYLKPVVVTTSYAHRNDALDKRYTSGRFSIPAHFSFDLRDTSATKYVYDIFDYLRRELPWFTTSVRGDSAPRFKDKPVIFFLDEQLVNWRQLNDASRIRNIAYIKVIEDFVDDDSFTRMISDIAADTLPTLKNPNGTDNKPSAMICIYTRQGNDWQSLPTDPGDLAVVPVKGFDRPLSWQTPDRTTWNWVPYSNNHVYSLNVPDAPPGTFKVVVQGVNPAGETFFFEEVLK